MVPAVFESSVDAPRLSAGQLAAVGLAHAGLLAVLLSPPPTPEAAAQPRPLTVSLIEPEVDMPQPEPEPATLTPRAAPTPKPVLTAQRPEPVPEPQPAAATPASQPDLASDVTSSLPAPAPVVEPLASEPVAPPTPPRPAGYLANPAPSYPPLSRRNGEQGTVRLNVLVNPDGSVARLELAQSSGHPRLDRSALETVQARWTFEPARQGGKPVAAWVIVPIQFILRS